MKKIPLLILLFVSISANSAETRCGWFENPSPANFSLTDNDGEWVISMQGRYSVDDASMDKLPYLDSSSNKVVNTNRNYGFSCACLYVETDTKTHRILSVISAKTLPLKQCLEDTKISNKIPIAR